MAKIGKFFKLPDGSFLGEIVTLSVQNKHVAISRISTAADEIDRYIVKIDDAEVGAGSLVEHSDGRWTIRLQIDDPSFSAPIIADLVETNDAGLATLVWSGKRLM